jgi:cytochrome c55X
MWSTGLLEAGTVALAVGSAALLTVAPAAEPVPQTAQARPAPAAQAASPAVQPTLEDPRLAAAWKALRTVYCERCHGKDYDGLAAPSIVAYAATQSREAFVRIVLDGDPPRGMPGYRDNPLVADNIDDIYRYFRARATGAIDATARPPVGQ